MTGAPILDATEETVDLPIDVIPGGWELIHCVGGDHHGARFWSRHPPATFRVIPDGDVYHQRDEGVWVAEGHAWTPTPASDDQMRLA